MKKSSFAAALCLIFIFLIFILCFLLIKDKPLYDDEPSHYTQIKLFLDRDAQIYPQISLIPGYHLLIATVAKLLHKTDIPFLRLISFTLSMISVYMFFLLSRTIDKKFTLIKTFQYSFFPVLFPYLFMLYTEGLSLLLIFASLYASIKKHYYFSGIFAIFSILTRQTNVFFLLLILLLNYFSNPSKSPTYEFIIKNIYFLIGLFIFGIFVFFNRGIAIGTQNMHPNLSFHTGNISFALFIFFFLFLPDNIKNLPKVINHISQNKKILLPLLIFLLVGALTLVNTHPWNHDPAHIRNSILLFFTSSFWPKIVFFIFVIYSILSISLIKLYKPSYYLLYPISMLLLIPIWLIEPRYLLPSLTLFILFKKSESKLIEYSTFGLYLLLSFTFYQGYLHQWFYL